MKDTALSLNERIAQRVRALRTEQELSLEELAERSGVSRSMISLIERAETSPTAVVLEKLAAAFGAVLSTLFEAQTSSGCEKPGPLVRHAEQVVWKDPDTGYVRRNVSPPGFPQPFQIVEVHFPPGARVVFDNASRHRPAKQQIWVLEGTIELTVGKERHKLQDGDCLAMKLDRPISFHNRTRHTARYAVVIATERFSR